MWTDDLDLLIDRLPLGVLALDAPVHVVGEPVSVGVLEALVRDAVPVGVAGAGYGAAELEVVPLAADLHQHHRRGARPQQGARRHGEAFSQPHHGHDQGGRSADAVPPAQSVAAEPAQSTCQAQA